MNGKDMVAVMMAINKLDGQSFTAKDEEVPTDHTGSRFPSEASSAALQLKRALVRLLSLPDPQQVSQLRQPAAESFPPQLPAQL